MTDFSKRVESIGESASIGLAAKVYQLREQGINVISLNVGETDFKTPAPVIEATAKALRENKTRYSLVAGISELTQEIASWYSKRNDFPIKAENVLLGVGSKHILYSIFQTLLNEGDEMIVPRPFWVTIPESIKLSMGVPVLIDSNDGKLDLKLVEAAITSKTKGIVINYPNNPSGELIDSQTQQDLITLCKQHDIWIISDEAYERILFDNNKHSSFLSADKQVYKKLVSVQSFSKTFCMTGFRIGMAIGPSDLILAMNKLHSHLTGNICTFAQYGALAALKMPEQYLNDLVAQLQTRRDLAFNKCIEIFPQTKKPGGAFYLFPDVSAELKTLGLTSSLELANLILDKAHVAILPGEFFGLKDHIRISFAGSENDIEEGMSRIANLMQKLLP